MKYKELQPKTALNNIKKGRLPYELDLNIYRGCEHSCKYCFAIYSHKYMESEDYFDEIFIKKDIAQILDQELTKRTQKKTINIGGVCDSYQPIEAQTEIMKDVLKVMIKHKNPIIISTKSDLILRDIELINELSQVASVNIAATITAMDENIRKIIEPNTTPSSQRFAMLKRIKEETNASVGVHLMPIIPYITGTKENLEAIYRNANEIGADYVLPGILYLRGKTRTTFFGTIDEQLPSLSSQLKSMYAYNFDRKPYKVELYTYINELKKKYNISSHYQKILNNNPKDIVQLSLF